MFLSGSNRSAAQLLPHLPRQEEYAATDESAQMSSPIEAARRATDDLELAREVQARLLPRKPPHMGSLSYSGLSIPVDRVGGDYFDFLDLGRGYLGLAVGDVAGKGVAAALQMANLQANVRSQCAFATDDIAILLRSVNHLFYENTPEAGYASLFFAEYGDRQQRLRYANCGHPPPLLLRTNGAVERLRATATVIGIQEDWDCAVAEVTLGPGDTLMLYTDGVTEARNEAGDEFGERRLAELLQAHYRLPASAMLLTIAGTLRQFARDRLKDDVTLVAARCGKNATS